MRALRETMRLLAMRVTRWNTSGGKPISIAWLILALALPASATTPASYSGDWGGSWYLTTRTSGNSSSCRAGTSTLSGSWAGFIARDGVFWGVRCGAAGESCQLQSGRISARGVLNLGPPFYICPANLDLHFALTPPSVEGSASCTVRGGFLLSSCDTEYEFTMRGGALERAADENYQGLWWKSPAGSEAGWGLSIAQQGATLFATWFTYDRAGKALWLVMPHGQKIGNAAYSGDLYRARGPAFDAIPWRREQVALSRVGNATLMFSDPDNGTFAYTIDDSDFRRPYAWPGLTQGKQITRQVFSSPVPNCAANGGGGEVANYQDLWWASPAGSESGWGLSIGHQGETLFAAWFTYDATGEPLWLVMPNGVRMKGVDGYSGALYQAAGPSFSAFDPEDVTTTQVGTATLSFSGANNGTFRYEVGGVAQSRAITRQVFSAPATVCR